VAVATASVATVLMLAGILGSGSARGQGTALEQKAAEVIRAADVLRDLEYARPGGTSLALDLYRPRGARGRLPVVVFIHGGGWREGDKAGGPSQTTAVLAGYGYAVASINYRLSTQAPFPAQIQDCKAAVRWLRAHADQYGLDPDRIGAWGKSAGGHLAALLGLAGDKPEWEVGEHLDQPSTVRAVCDFFGPTDLTNLGGGPLARERIEMLRQLVGGLLREKQAELREASPLSYVSRGDPPFFIAHGVDDELVPMAQSQSLYQALRAKGVPATFLAVRKAGHGFSKDSLPTEGQIYIQTLAFFDRTLKGRR
jgi:acetyl esterase/lipase